MRPHITQDEIDESIDENEQILSAIERARSGGGQAHVPSCAFFIGEKQELSDHLIRSFFPIVIDQKSDPKYSCNNNREVNRV
jgi:hypothetical protein